MKKRHQNNDASVPYIKSLDPSAHHPAKLWENSSFVYPPSLMAEINQFAGLFQHGIVHSRSQSLIDFTCAVAAWAHRDQARKFSGKPYVYHAIEVAQYVSEVTDDAPAICAALLHDTKEDCGFTREFIITGGLGFDTADLVEEVTNPVHDKADTTRAMRHRANLAHISKATWRGQTIKVADILSNVGDLHKVPDVVWARIYAKEKLEALDHLPLGNRFLYETAYEMIENFLRDSK